MTNFIYYDRRVYEKNKAFFLSALVLILNSCAEASDAPGTLGNTEVPMPTDAGNTEENTLPGTASAAPEPTVSGTNSIVTADTAIPFGESICADLDGDGVPEELTMRLLPDSASDNWRFARPELTVGETVFDGDYFSRLIGSGRFDAEAWYLLDIDRTDSSLELGLFRKLSRSMRRRFCSVTSQGSLSASAVLLKSFWIPHCSSARPGNRTGRR